MRKSYSPEFKTKVVNAYSAGATISELSNQYGVSRSTLYIWIYESQSKTTVDKKNNMRDYFNLKQKCEKQATIIEILQNAPCIVSAPLSERYVQAVAYQFTDTGINQHH